MLLTTREFGWRRGKKPNFSYQEKGQAGESFPRRVNPPGKEGQGRKLFPIHKKGEEKRNPGKRGKNFSNGRTGAEAKIRGLMRRKRGRVAPAA